jgi:hypothetical protein
MLEPRIIRPTPIATQMPAQIGSPSLRAHAVARIADLDQHVLTRRDLAVADWRRSALPNTKISSRSVPLRRRTHRAGPRSLSVPSSPRRTSALRRHDARQRSAHTGGSATLLYPPAVCERRQAPVCRPHPPHTVRASQAFRAAVMACCHWWWRDALLSGRYLGRPWRSHAGNVA